VEIEAALRLYAVPPEQWIEYVEVILSLDEKWMEDRLKPKKEKEPPDAGKTGWKTRT